MKKLFLLVAVAGMFVACNNKSAENNEQKGDSIVTEVVAETVDSMAVDSMMVTVDSVATEMAK